MKRSILFLLICLPIFLFSQSKLELIGSLDYSYRTFGNSGIVQSVRSSSEIPKLNFHSGINYHQQLKEKLWLKIGLGFSKMGYKTKNTELIGGINPQGGFDPSIPTGISMQFKYNFQFLEIPIALRYEFSQKRFKPFIEIGVSTKYYLQSENISFQNGEQVEFTKTREDIITQIQYAPTLSLGFSYEINDKWELVMQPNFNYHLSNIYRETANLSLSSGLVKEHQFSGGLAIGVRMKLK